MQPVAFKAHTFLKAFHLNTRSVSPEWQQDCAGTEGHPMVATEADITRSQQDPAALSAQL